MPASSHTFFVVAKRGLDGKASRIVAATRSSTPREDLEGFEESSFPLCLVSAVCLQPGLRPFAFEELWTPWYAIAVPSGVRTQAGQSSRLAEFVDPLISINGQAVEYEERITLVDRIEALSCSYAELLASEKAIESDHSFLTTGPKAVYCATSCSVRLNIRAWADLPRCLESYDDVFRPRPGSVRADYKPSAVEEFVELTAGPLDTLARSRFHERASRLGPHCGSFIPCSLWCGFDLHESECVLEITGDRQSDEWPCILHVLSATACGGIYPGMRLRTRTEVFDRRTGRYKEVLSDVGEIRDA